MKKSVGVTCYLSLLLQHRFIPGLQTGNMLHAGITIVIFQFIIKYAVYIECINQYNPDQSADAFHLSVHIRIHVYDHTSR